MQCPNPDCEDPGQASILLLSGENITCCPKCGEVLRLHEDRFDFQEEENEGSQGKNEHLKASIQENSKGKKLSVNFKLNRYQSEIRICILFKMQKSSYQFWKIQVTSVCNFQFKSRL